MNYPRQAANIVGGNVFHCKFLNLQWHYSSVCQYPAWGGFYIAVRKNFPPSRCCIFALSVQLLVRPWGPEIPRSSHISPLFSLCSDTINKGMFHSLVIHRSTPLSCHVDVWQRQMLSDGGDQTHSREWTVWNPGSISHQVLLLHFWTGNIQLLAKNGDLPSLFMGAYIFFL